MTENEEIPKIDYLFFKLSPENKKILLKSAEKLSFKLKKQALKAKESAGTYHRTNKT